MSDESLSESSKDDSSNSGYSSNHQTSTFNVTILKYKRKADTMGGESDFDNTPHESKSGDLNYITKDTLSQKVKMTRKVILKQVLK